MKVELTLPNAKEITPDQLRHAYREMVRARYIDEKAIVLYKQNKSHFHIGVAGHEAVQVAAADCMEPGKDYFYPYYRGMALCAGLGMTSREFMLNIMNKAEDPNSGGRQMPMHYGKDSLNIVSQSSPTGTQYLQAVGAAHALKYRGDNSVVLVSSGEGTTAQGAYHEALNWAAREQLAVIFLIQNNKFAISVHVSEQLAGSSVASISSGYSGLEVHSIDGLNYETSYQTLSHAVERARKGQGPSVIEAEVVRLRSHSISDNQEKYRPIEDITKDQELCPIKKLREYLTSQEIITDNELDIIDAEIKEEVDEAAEWADAQPSPEPHTYADHLLAPETTPPAESEPNGEELFMVDAINRALDEELSNNEEMVIFGQDVAHGKGGVFTVTAGLTEKYGKKRVFNAPLAEASIAGVATGMATLGMKPVAEIQFGDYIWTGMMQIRNELPMMRYRSNGMFSCPAVIRVAIGGYIHGALYHSQNIEATFSHFPGLVVVLPSNAADAKGLLKSAIRSNDPVLFLEHKGLYRQVYAKRPVGGADDLVPIGKAKIVREGTDATIVTYGALVQKSLLAAEALAKEGKSVEIVDLRTISPLDTETVLNSAKKTSRVLVAHEDVKFMGFGAEISAMLSEEAFGFLDAPVKRVAGKFTPVPHAPDLEQEVLPQNKDVEDALRELLSF